MNRKHLQNFYGLKHNPFSPSIPVYGLHQNSPLETFKFRMNKLTEDGGFALLTGDPGLGKSALLRSLVDDLNSQTNYLTIAEINRPQSSVSDFYRELGEIFGIELKLFNKFHGFKSLREKWGEHLQKTLLKPLIIIDESQEADPDVLSEIRLLSSSCFDSKLLVTVLLSGDLRLVEKLKSPKLLPLYTRMSVKLELRAYSTDELEKMLKDVIIKAGNPSLMTEGLIKIISKKSYGNPRVMMNTCSELLLNALNNKEKEITEDQYLQYYGQLKGKSNVRMDG